MFLSPVSENNLPPVEVNLIGEKVMHPVVHFCELCSFPIRLYGRLIPCKHVYCYSCAKKCDNYNEKGQPKCPKCNGEVKRIEELSPDSMVWMCDAGGPNCKRTYLSQRDLLSHINMRHKDAPTTTANCASMATNSSMTTNTSVPPPIVPTLQPLQQVTSQPLQVPPISIPPPNMSVPPPSLGIPPPNMSVPPPNFLPPPRMNVPPISSGVNSNLISVPIQQPPMISLPGNPPILPGNPPFMLPPPNMMPPPQRPQNSQMRF